MPGLAFRKRSSSAAGLTFELVLDPAPDLAFNEARRAMTNPSGRIGCTLIKLERRHKPGRNPSPNGSRKALRESVRAPHPRVWRQARHNAPRVAPTAGPGPRDRR